MQPSCSSSDSLMAVAPALKAINLENDWIARLAFNVDLRLCTARVLWPTRSRLKAWVLVGRGT